MIKCPNCGSSAQIKLLCHDTFIWRNTVTVYLTYKCGCGRHFSTSIAMNKDQEVLHNANIDKVFQP